MGLRDILVCVDSSTASLSRLELAVDLAARHGSRLTALYSKEWSAEQLHQRSEAEMGLVSAKAMRSLDQRIEASIEAAAEPSKSALESLGRRHGVVTEWLYLSGPASATVPQLARYSDLCIVGRNPATDDYPEQYSFAEKLLFVTGRPVLFIPPAKPSETLGRRIAVAWNSSRPATRALNDAMPLIQRAERVTVMTVNAADYMARFGAPPSEKIVEYLTRHGVATDLLELDGVRNRAIAEELQANAMKSGADLLVAGAFGHPKLWEKFLGGVTRDLLDRMEMPVFMSH